MAGPRRLQRLRNWSTSWTNRSWYWKIAPWFESGYEQLVLRILRRRERGSPVAR
jgi:hypothetical protein